MGIIILHVYIECFFYRVPGFNIRIVGSKNWNRKCKQLDHFGSSC